jgi:hypothetical protein
MPRHRHLKQTTAASKIRKLRPRIEGVVAKPFQIQGIRFWSAATNRRPVLASILPFYLSPGHTVFSGDSISGIIHKRLGMA